MDLHQKISSSIHKIQSDWERSGHSGQGISRIDKDILIQDLRRLYDLVFELEIGSSGTHEVVDKSKQKVENHHNETTKTSIQEVQVQEEFKIEENHIIEQDHIHQEKEQQQKPEVVEPEIIENEVSVKIEESKKDIEDILEKTIPGREVSTSDKSIEESPDNVSAEESVVTPPTAKKSLARKPAKSTSEKFHAPKTFADIYQNNGDNSLASKMQKNSIADIKSAIGINDKFLFINGIFKGDSQSYHQAIETINNFHHFHEALEYIEHIKVENNIGDSEAVTGLIEIIKRKFQ